MIIQLYKQKKPRKNNMLNTSIISIGDEILIGQILNSNSKWLAEQLTNRGCKINKITSISDARQDIISELDDLLPKSDIIIITGGLGPTHDDITKDVLCEYFKDSFVENKVWTEHLVKLFQKRGLELSDRNKPQAFIPSRSELLWNKLGTAPGMLFKENGKYIFSLPGVPQEMVCIMEDVAFDIIDKFNNEHSSDLIIYKNIQTSGIGESYLADLIKIIPEILGNSSLAFLPSYRGVKLRIGAYGINKSSAEKELSRLDEYITRNIKDYIISNDERNYAEIVAEILINKKLTISAAESCTAGMLSSALTDIAGSSKFFTGGIVTYSNEAKINNLKVSADTIEKYGAVSKETAIEMSRNIRQQMNTDFAISITGIAGPDGGTTDKPVGTVWVSISYATGDFPILLNLRGDRKMIRERTVQSVLVELIKILRTI